MFDILLNSYTFKVVTIGCSLLGMISAIIGTFAVLKKESLLGDGVAHSSLAGICIAFLLTGRRELFILLIGALIMGLICVLLIHYIGTNSKVKFDSAIALILSTFFGLGLVLLTYLKRIPGAKKAGLSNFIFGQASTLILKDIYLITGVGLILLILVIFFWKQIKISIFDKEYAKTIGINSDRYRLLVSVMIVINVIIGLQIAGVVLMTAMMISPVVAARQWSNKLNIVVILSSIFGAISGFIGSLSSSLNSSLPTGPVIVVVLSIFVMFSMLFSNKRGLIYRYISRKKFEREIKRKWAR
ncbi:metal ABC transporter permease [Streptobacillus moniliformis]|uniref:ABC-3 protein n=2 Tax=Streptobacillus moniliformis TaxID=34105 RepID=D1AWN4_STRM9|nr:metal ABC transporter permease [Streptobacillus moniliformis]ACZ00710.1 ABC-3 protein [Streptobacillus moniliformis DSM 12112]AVL42891.1 metal ABC transporter permease [Streptobacillus moniliformis]SQA14162.1 Manganese transport system membrane protein mntB [Streptobacillus moniliformis]